MAVSTLDTGRLFSKSRSKADLAVPYMVSSRASPKAPKVMSQKTLLTVSCCSKTSTRVPSMTRPPGAV